MSAPGLVIASMRPSFSENVSHAAGSCPDIALYGHDALEVLLRGYLCQHAKPIRSRPEQAATNDS